MKSGGYLILSCFEFVFEKGFGIAFFIDELSDLVNGENGRDKLLFYIEAFKILGQVSDLSVDMLQR